MKIWFILIVLIMPSLNSQVRSVEVLTPIVKQGGVAVFRILPQFQGSNECVSVFGKQYMSNRYGEVFVGVSTDAKIGKYDSYLVECGRGVRLYADKDEVEVLKIKFPETRILAKMTIVDPVLRVRETMDMASAYQKGNSWQIYTDGKYRMPVDSPTVTDVFGRKRIYLDGESVHGGVDLKAFIGTPVKTINSGTVILADKFSLEGNMVVVDHGSGIFSLYLHLSIINVRQGDKVSNGQVMGLSGDTGAVTGPHLHLAVKVSGTNVDPLEFINTVNQYLK